MKVLLVFIILFFSFLLFYTYKLFQRIMAALHITSWFHKIGIVAMLVPLFLFLRASDTLSITVLFLMHFLVLSVITDLIYHLIKRRITGTLFHKLYRTLLIPLFFTIGLFIFGWFNIQNIVQTNYTLHTDKKIGGSVRILFIADSHYGSIINQTKLDMIKEKLDHVNADIVILGGDIIDEETSKEEMEYIFKTFGSIRNTQGIYFVYGNHDRQLYSSNRAYTEAELCSALTSNHITILQDSHVTLPNNIVIAGREDYGLERKSPDDFLTSVSPEQYLIMADHQPVGYSENIAHGVDLILSGHTHAGQIFPAELFINLFKTADLAYGHRSYDSMDAIVTSGFVGWGWPVRTARHSEYVVIDIRETSE